MPRHWGPKASWSFNDASGSVTQTRSKPQRQEPQMSMQARTLSDLMGCELPPTYASKYFWSVLKFPYTTFWSCGIFCAHPSTPLVSSPTEKPSEMLIWPFPCSSYHLHLCPAAAEQLIVILIVRRACTCAQHPSQVHCMPPTCTQGCAPPRCPR